jgi:hypothetical protein
MPVIKNKKSCMYCGKDFQEADAVGTLIGTVATGCLATGNVPGVILSLGAGALIGAFKAASNNGNTPTRGTCSKCSKKYR